MSTYGPEYRLLWPAALFQEEARRIAGIDDPLDRSEQAHTLVSDAFASGVPVRDLSAAFQHNIWETRVLQRHRGAAPETGKGRGIIP